MSSIAGTHQTAPSYWMRRTGCDGKTASSFFAFLSVCPEPARSWQIPVFISKCRCTEKGPVFRFPQEFVNVTETVVENNQVGPSVVGIGGKQSTRATIRASVAPGTQVLELDFGEALLFGSAVRKQYVVFGCELLRRNDRLPRQAWDKRQKKPKRNGGAFHRSVSTRPTAG